MENIDSVPSNVQSSRQEALLYVFEDNEAVIKMIIKGRSPTMRHVSRTHRVALDLLFRSNRSGFQNPIKYIDTKNQLADILTKGNFTHDEWNHLLTLFNISHFSSTACTAAMANRASTRIRRRTSHSKIKTYDESQREDAIGRVVFNFIQARGRDGTEIKILGDLLLQMIDQGNLIDSPQLVFKIGLWPFLVFSRVEKWGYGTRSIKETWQNFLECGANKFVPHHGDTLLDGGAQSVRYGGMLHDRSGQPCNANSQEEADSETFVMGSDATEFANKVKDQMRKRQKKCRTFCSVRRRTFKNLGNAATFKGKNFLDNQDSIMNSTDLTLKKMFDISAKLVGEQEEINNSGQDSLGKTFMETSVIDWWRNRYQSSTRKTLRLLRFCVVSWKVHQHPQSNQALKEKIGRIITDKSYRDYDGINGEPDRIRVEYFHRIHNVAALR